MQLITNLAYVALIYVHTTVAIDINPLRIIDVTVNVPTASFDLVVAKALLISRQPEKVICPLELSTRV
jgi:hypothetical protein